MPRLIVDKPAPKPAPTQLGGVAPAQAAHESAPVEVPEKAPPAGVFQRARSTTTVADATNAMRPGNGLSTLDLRLGNDGLHAGGTGHVGAAAIGANGVVDATGVKTAKATAALKALLGNTSLDDVGGSVVITNNRLTKAQFAAAIETVFGEGATLAENGTFTWTKATGVDAKLVAAYRAVVDGVQVSTHGTLELHDGAVAGDVQAQVRALVGNGVLVADNRVVFADNKWQSAALHEEIEEQLGPSASLDAVVKATVDANGVKTALATAALKALVGHTSISAKNGFTIVNNGLTKDQFQAAVTTIFGPNAKLSADGTFTWTKASGVDAQLVTSYRAAVAGLTVAADATLSLKKGAVAGDVSVHLQELVGDGAIISDAKVVFADDKLPSVELSERAQQQFGDAGSLDATFSATVDGAGVKTATATAAVKMLVGNTSIDTTGTSVTITNNGLSKAEFAAAIATVFGDGAKVNANGSFTWTKESGVSASLVAAYQGVVAGIDVAADGNLTLKDGALAGDVTLHLQKIVGDGVLVANNQIVLANSRIASAHVDDTIQEKLGPNASIAATLQASVDHAGIQTMTATAAFKALLGGNTTIDTSGSGLTIVNNKLSRAQFQSAIKTVFGSNAFLAANGSFKWDKASVIDAQVVADFKGTVRGIDVDTGGTLAVKDGAVAGDVEVHAKRLLGSTVLIADDKLVFEDSRLASVALDHQAMMAFGASASLAATFQATIDREGIASMKATAAFKAVAGNTTVDTSGTGFTITRGQLTQAQLQAAVTTLFGPNAKVSADGRFTWSKDAGVDAQLAASFAGLVRAFAVKSDGTIALQDGMIAGDVGVDVKRVLGATTIVSNGKLVFGDGGFESASFGADVTHEFGPTASLDATIAASIDAAGKANASIKIAAFKRLKELGDGGSIDIKPDGSVDIKDGKIDRAEVGALVSVVAGKRVDVDTSGKLVYADGKIDAQLNANLASTWNNTKVNANGALSLVDGKPQLKANASALFGGDTVGVGGVIGVDGVSQASVDFKLAKLFGSRLDATGSLVLARGQVQASLTTNLVVGGDAATKIGVGGVVACTDKKKAAQLKAQIDAGVVSGGFDVSTQATSEVYTPGVDDPVRASMAQSGAAWSVRDVTYEASANAGADFTIMAGAVPVQLGFKASGDIAREVKVLSVHPSLEDAEAEHAVFAVRAPKTVDDVLAMKPYEQVSESGTQSMGVTGHVALGLGAGPVNASVGGEVYCQLTGNATRDIERLDGNLVRVRFRRESGDSTVKALSLSVGVKAPHVTGNDVVDKAAAPLVEQLAQLGMKQTWEKMSSKDTAFDVTIDASTPAGRAALEHLLMNDLSEAQYWARSPNSGVTLNANAVSTVSAKTNKLDVDVATLSKEDMARWLTRQERTLTKDSYTMTSALDFTAKDDAFWPWNPTKSADVRLVHETQLPAIDAPDFSLEAVEATKTMRVRVPPPRAQPRNATLDDTRALLGVRMKVADPKTSLADMRRNLRPGLETMRLLGFSDDEMRPLARLQDAIAKGAVPDKKAVFWGMGDQRFGATSVEVEGFVSPSGLKNVLGSDPPRTRDDFVRAYVDAQGALMEPSLFAKSRILENVAQTLGCDVAPNATGGFVLTRGDDVIGRLSDADVTALQSALLAAPSAADVRVPAGVGTFFHGRPKELVHVDAFGRDADVRARAFKFADSLLQASALYAANQMPAQQVGESDADYAQRVDDFKKTSLYEKPDDFYAQIDAWMKSALDGDHDMLPGPLALLTLAGEPSIYGRVELEVPKEAGAAMIDAGRREVQRFGAFQLLVAMGARIDTETRTITIAAGNKADVASAAVKALFGDKAKLGGTHNGRVDVVGAQLDEERMQKLATLFDDVTLEGGALQLPDGFDGEVARGALDAVSAAAVSRGRQIVFDNTSFDFVHVGDALESLFGKDAFGAHDAGVGPPRFPVLVPIDDEGAAQDPDAIGTDIALRHVGAQASWGSQFSQIAYLRGKRNDLASQAPADDWLLKERVRI